MTIEKLSPAFVTDFPDEWYDYNLADHFWFAWRIRALQHLLDEIPHPRAEAPLLALEIGCGVGFFRRQVEACTAWTVDGADLNAPALEKAEPSRGRTLLYNIEDRHASLKEKYDVLLLFDVLEHISDPGRFLDAALWHLKPGGALIINVPALRGLYSRYDQLVGHFTRYQKGSMHDLLEAPGRPLDVRDLRYWGLSLIPVAAVRKFLLRKVRTPGEAVSAGFKVAAPSINQAFNWLGRVEMTLLRRPLAGTSLMALAIKKAP